jgi:hypothetical protein
VQVVKRESRFSLETLATGGEQVSRSADYAEPYPVPLPPDGTES